MIWMWIMIVVRAKTFYPTNMNLEDITDRAVKSMTMKTMRMKTILYLIILKV